MLVRLPLNTNERSTPIVGNGYLSASSGELIVGLKISGYHAPAIEYDQACACVEMLFVDSDQQRWRHWTVVASHSFFPSSEDVVTWEQFPTTYECALGATPQQHNQYRVRVHGDEDIVGRWPGGYHSCAKVVGDRIHLSFRYASLDPRAINRQLQFAYDYPITRLLWRRGPAYEGKKIIPEAADCVMLEPAPADWEGAPPSPVEVRLADGSLATPEMFTVKALRKRGIVIPWAPSIAEERRRRGPRMLKANVSSQPIRIGFTGAAAGEEPCWTSGSSARDGVRRSMRLEPGLVEGLLRLQRYSSESQAADCIGVVFDFLDEDANAWRHWSLVRPFLFWPTEDDVAEISTISSDQPWDLIFDTLLDSRDEFVVRVSNGQDIEGTFKYMGTELWAKIKGDHVEVTFTVVPIIDHPAAVKNHVTFRYQMPIERLLWRFGPKIEDGETLPEEGKRIYLEPLTGDDAAALRGVRRSPVRVHDAAGD